MTVIQIWLLALVFKILFLPVLPITPDETYYFAWARHLQLSYYDHPPFISWIMSIALPLWKTPLGIRLPGVLVSHMSLLPWLAILKKFHFSTEAQKVWLAAILLGPLTGLCGFFVTPDVPLVLFWSLALLWALKVAEKPNINNWFFLGVFLGLGFLSKYTMVLFIPAFLLWLYWEKKLSILVKPGALLGTLIVLILFTPVLIWNYKNSFASFAFQLNHGLESQSIQLNYLLEYLSAQFGLLNPLLAIIAFWVMKKHWSKYKFFICFGLTPLIFFSITSLRARVEANWPLCSYPAILALFATIIDRPSERKQWMPLAKTGFGVAVIFFFAIVIHAIHPWIPIPYERDHTMIMHEWAQDVKTAKKYRPLFARSYQMAAYHSYFRDKKDEVYKIAGFNRKDFYDFLPQSYPKEKSYIILKGDDVLPEKIMNDFVVSNPRPLPSGLLIFELTPRNLASK